MAIYNGGEFLRMIFNVDGNEFQHGTFHQCTFLFDGRAPGKFVNCRFTECMLGVKPGADQTKIQGLPKDIGRVPYDGM